MTQEEIFREVYEKYAHIFPEMLHSSGGLPDAKGPGTSDVDISLFNTNPSSLAHYFPDGTEIDNTRDGRTLYKLKGYLREVTIYCLNGPWWNQAALHRQTELALNENTLLLWSRPIHSKKELGISSEAAWAKVLGLGDDYFEALLDTEKILEIARTIK